MTIQKISTWLQNTGTVAALIATSTFATGLQAPAASAASFNLVGTQEGELNVGVDGGDYIGTHSLIDSIESLVDSSSNAKNLLFVDSLATRSQYRNGSIDFLKKDAGTNQTDYWFRPSDPGEEKGQLEVGTFKFNFTQMLDDLTIDFYDVESWETGVLEINGLALDSPNYLRSAPNNAIQSLTFNDVESIVLKLGKDKPSGTGDGVSFRMTATLNDPIQVPEPSVILGLGAVAAGVLGLRKGKSSI
jgi:hypothetical protein